MILNRADSNFLIQLNSKTFEIFNPTLNHTLQDISDIISVTVGDQHMMISGFHAVKESI